MDSRIALGLLIFTMLAYFGVDMLPLTGLPKVELSSLTVNQLALISGAALGYLFPKAKKPDVPR